MPTTGSVTELDRLPGHLFAAWQEISEATAKALTLDSEVGCIFETLAQLRFEIATVSLVDDCRSIIETFRGWNVPSQWVKLAKHSLNSNDIQVDVVKNGDWRRIDGWGKEQHHLADRLDREIFERFEHWKYSRIWVPLLDKGVAVGTIEAGCVLEHKRTVLTESNIEAVRRLGNEHGPAISQARPFVLLRLIAEKAVEIIGCDAASLHVYKSNVYELSNLLLMAGARIPSEELATKYSPANTGTYKVFETSTPLVYPSANESRNIDLPCVNAQAIAAYPLSLGAHRYGVFSIYFNTVQHFHLDHVQVGWLFARQIAIAAQSCLLLRDLAAPAGLASNLSSFQNAIRSLDSDRSLQEVLEEVARSILYMLEADCVTLYQFSETENRFKWPPVMMGYYRQRDAMHTQIHENDLVWKIVRQQEPLFVSNVRTDLMFSAPGNHEGKSRFVEREGIDSCAAIALRPEPGNEIVGCLFISFRSKNLFSDEDREAIAALASAAAIAIQTARLRERLKRTLTRRDQHLLGLWAVDDAIVSAPAPELEKVLNVVVEQVVTITGATSGQIMWIHRGDNVLCRKAAHGYVRSSSTYSLALGTDTISQVAIQREPRLFSDESELREAARIGAIPIGTGSQAAVPLVDSEDLLGVLSVERTDDEIFTSDDISLLQRFAVQAVIAVHTVNLYWRLQRQIKPLKALTEIAGRIQDVRSDTKANLRMLLTGITAGESLGLSRAMLFLIRKENERLVLRGEMAIGAQTQKEADDTWIVMENQPTKDLSTLLDEAVEFSNAISSGRKDDHGLNTSVQKIVYPIEEAPGALKECAASGKTVLVAYNEKDPVRTLLSRLCPHDDRDKEHTIVCVPLLLRGTDAPQAIGALICDNRFLVKEREIDPECIRGIEAFAAVAAMSIENERLRKDVEDEKRLIEWRRSTHTAKNWIACRFQTIARTAERINVELKELEKQIDKTTELLSQYDKSGNQRAPQFTEFNMLDALQDVRPHNVGWTVDVDAPYSHVTGVPVLADKFQMTSVFIELAKNALDAMSGHDVTDPKINIRIGVEPEGSDSNWARIEFADNGPGIEEGKERWIFGDFHSTKPDGTGFGLSIVEGCVRAHGGTIEVSGRRDGGACFVLHLPILKRGER